MIFIYRKLNFDINKILFFVFFFYRYCTELFYRENPIKIVRCQGSYIYDQLGNKYLDCINNVAHGINEFLFLFNIM